MKPCCICRTPIQPFISFGRMPIANGFLTPDEFASEYFYSLGAGVCPKCHMVQLTELVEREKMFHDHYAFFSSSSARMAEHFQRFAEEVCATHLRTNCKMGRVTSCGQRPDEHGAHGVPRPTSSNSSKADPFVVEIGSNDGVMLQHFARAGIRHVGIEPSANVAGVARSQGVETICDFFDESLARRIVSEHGQADVVLAANVMCHMADLNSVVAGIKLLLKPRGVLIFEDPYLGDIIEQTAYDQIYDEHVFYFSVTALDYLFAQHAMEIVDVSPQPVHGGSMRYTVAHRGAMDGRLVGGLAPAEQRTDDRGRRAEASAEGGAQSAGIGTADIRPRLAGSLAPPLGAHGFRPGGCSPEGVSRPAFGAVAAQRERERALGLDQPATFERFRRNVEKSRADLMALLRQLKADGKRVVGYAATSKSTTVTNYCGITPGLVEFISDTTPLKQGKFSPGAHIPIRPAAEFSLRYPDYALLFAWNHAGEIMAKEAKFTAAGGKWITYVPGVLVLR